MDESLDSESEVRETKCTFESQACLLFPRFLLNKGLSLWYIKFCFVFQDTTVFSLHLILQREVFVITEGHVSLLKHTCIISPAHYPHLIKLKHVYQSRKRHNCCRWSTNHYRKDHLPDCPDCCCLPGLSPARPQWETPGSLCLRSAGPERNTLPAPAIVSHHPSLLPNPLSCNCWCTREAFKSNSLASWTFTRVLACTEECKCLPFSI